MLSTPNMGLIAWNQPSDPYNSQELAENFVRLDLHDHTEGRGQRIGTAAITDQAITASKLHPTAVAGAIGTGTVDTLQLADNSVTRAKVTKSFIQGKRATLSSVSSVTVTWAASFGDTNYTVAYGIDYNGIEPWITAQTATTVTLALGATVTGTIHVIGIHD